MSNTIDKITLLRDSHCARKHFKAAIHILHEILEKLVRVQLNKPDDQVKYFIDLFYTYRGVLRAMYVKFVKLDPSNLEKTKQFLFELLDDIRTVRGDLSKLEIDLILNPSRYSVKSNLEHALHEDLIDLDGNLYALEIHISNILSNIYKEEQIKNGIEHSQKLDKQEVSTKR